MKTKQPLGKVELRFNDEGYLISQAFIGCIFDALPTTEHIKSTDDPDQLCEIARRVFANLFTQVNNVELADREKYTISSVLEKTQKNESGIITDARISFSLDEI